MTDHGRDNFPPGTGPRIALAYATLFLTLGIVTPYLQVLLREQGFGKAHVGLILGTLEAMAVLAPPLWGYLSDRTCRPRLAMACAMAGAMATFVLFGLTRHLLPAVGVAMAFGLFYRPTVPLTDGYTFRTIHTAGGDYGKVRVCGSLAFITAVGVLEVLGVAGRLVRPLVLIGMPVAGALYLLSLLRLPGDSAADPGPGAAARPRPDWSVFLGRSFVLFTLCAFLGRMAMMSYYGFFSLFLKEKLGFANAGYIWMLGPLSEIPIVYFSHRIMRRIGVRSLFALGLLGCTVRLIAFSYATHVWHVIPLQLLHALTFGAYHTASVTYVSRTVPVHMKASAQTLFAALSGGLGGLCGGAVAGLVAETWGFAVLYRSFGFIALAGLVILLAAVPKVLDQAGGEDVVRKPVRRSADGIA